MASFLRPVKDVSDGQPSPPANPRAGTRVALAFPLLALLPAGLWLASAPPPPTLPFWTLFVLPAVCAAYGLFPVAHGPRLYFSFEAPTVLLAGLVGGPLAGLVAGLATGLGDVNSVWRRRSAYGGLAMLYGVNAGLAGDIWRAGHIPLGAAALAAGLGAFAITCLGVALVILDRQMWPSPLFARGSAQTAIELVVSTPFILVLAGSFSAAPALNTLAVGSGLAIIGLTVRALTTQCSLIERERQSRLSDWLTGALSRPALEEALEREQARIVRGERSAGLIVCDIDYFKQLNDCHGHAGGDQALRSVVERIRQAARTGDLVARWGGDEFCVLAPGIGSLGELEALSERIRATVSSAPMTLGREATAVTISIGATTLCDWLDTAQAFDRADEALYEAKRRRDAVCVLPPKRPALEAPTWALKRRAATSN
jgi:diguanylate cyclase (GGDEF)-like protein